MEKGVVIVELMRSLVVIHSRLIRNKTTTMGED